MKNALKMPIRPL